MAKEQGHILVVDDNRMNRIKLSRSLEHQGYTVGLAEDGQQALEMLKSQPFDVVLLDIIMPGMDGYQVLEAIKSDLELRDLPVIVISALDETDSAVRCIEMGAEDYLPKPFNPVLLRARLNASLQKKMLRDLEKAYLQQEVMLRQSEKLATLGKLSAGLAHELNNPAAAAQRGASQLQAAVSHLQQTHLKLGELDLTDSQLASLLSLDKLARERAKQPADMESLTRSDREYELETWLDERGVENAWEAAPTLVDLGYDCSELETMVASFDASDPANPTLWVRYDNPRMRYKERKLLLEPDIMEVLEEYLQQYELEGALFNCTARNLEYILRDVAQAADIDKKVSFEMLRWTGAVRDYRRGMSSDRLREKLGLSRISWRETGVRIGARRPGKLCANLLYNALGR